MAIETRPVAVCNGCGNILTPDTESHAGRHNVFMCRHDLGRNVLTLSIRVSHDKIGSQSDVCTTCVRKMLLKAAEI